MNEENKEEESTKKSLPRKRRRRNRPFPKLIFEEAIKLAEAIQKHASGQKVRRLTLFDALGKSPDSSVSRELITSSAQYGLTKGSYGAEFLELTPDGSKATSPDSSEKEKREARIKCAIDQVAPYRELYEGFKGNRLPSREVLIDRLREIEIDDDYLSEGVESFILNGQAVGIISELAGAERIVPKEQVLESASAAKPSKQNEQTPVVAAGPSSGSGTSMSQKKETDNFEKICFYVTPIGSEESEQRKHSDLFMGSLVEPAVEEFGFTLVRADKIEKPGIITSQIIEYLLKAKLVIADLSFHNPNVFYELSLRHASRLPVVQIARSCDRIPFDIDQFRTIQIDTTDIYTLVPKIPTYQAAIANQIRSALADPDSVGSPVSVYFPNLKVTF